MAELEEKTKAKSTTQMTMQPGAVPYGHLIQNKDDAVYVYVGHTPVNTVGNVLHTFVAVGEYPVPGRWEYRATHWDTLIKYFPELRAVYEALIDG